eukprot:CAMPEP_0184313684 /NCGR_PEP_ID=MMETSP1049-20130417/66335_1 /TAXON_ID=77928 /ORGANISM="Proteomonas sulcata, Strain CCMP704" /LENGTH=180 /DNA_ID=CAMNT_0026631119 /DNA_START=355 /DNA_END=897 /DNA_ORIENTATION=-
MPGLFEAISKTLLNAGSACRLSHLMSSILQLMVSFCFESHGASPTPPESGPSFLTESTASQLLSTNAEVLIVLIAPKAPWTCSGLDQKGFCLGARDLSGFTGRMPLLDLHHFLSCKSVDLLSRNNIFEYVRELLSVFLAEAEACGSINATELRFSACDATTVGAGTTKVCWETFKGPVEV